MQIDINDRYKRYLVFMLTDYISVIIALVFALRLTVWASLRVKSFYFSDPYFYFWVPLIFVVMGHLNSVYHMRPIVQAVQKSFYSVGISIVFSLLLLYFVHNQAVVSGWFPMFFVICIYVVCGISEYMVRRYLKDHNLLYEKVLVIGAGLTAEKALRFYKNDLGYRYDIVGVVDDNPKSDKLTEMYPLLGDMDHAAEIAEEQGVSTALVIAPGMEKEKLIRVMSQVQPHVRNLHFVPDLIGVQTSNVVPIVMFSEEMLVLKLKNQLARRRNQIFKRAFDLVCCLLGLLPTLLILAAVAIAIRRESDGPIFYNAPRIGRDGKPFLCLKFRSMYTNNAEILEKYLAENPAARAEWDEYQKLRGYDPRITRVGAFIRKTSLDELPQVINVIRGEMSLVGPRPYLPRERELMGDNIDAITLSKPGITGLWQTSGRSECTFEERLHLETWYVHNWSVWLDLVLLFKTFRTVIYRDGAV